MVRRLGRRRAACIRSSAPNRAPSGCGTQPNRRVPRRLRCTPIGFGGNPSHRRRVIAALDFLWVWTCALLLIVFWCELSTAGRLLAFGISIPVAVFAVLQWRATTGRVVRASRIRWAVRVAVTVLAIGPLGAALLHQAMASAEVRRYANQGRFVDVEGRSLFIDCRGEGAPTVIFEPGAGARGPACNRRFPTRPVGTARHTTKDYRAELPNRAAAPSGSPAGSSPYAQMAGGRRPFPLRSWSLISLPTAYRFAADLPRSWQTTAGHEERDFLGISNVLPER